MTAPCAEPRARGSGPRDVRVVVVGSGLAGLTAACDLADAGFAVTVLEARSRLGGATFSFQRDGLTVDNGQHVTLRCCTAYHALLTRLGSADGLELQDRFRGLLSPSLRRIGLGSPGSDQYPQVVVVIPLKGWAVARSARVPGSGGLTSRSSRSRFVTQTTWQVKLAMCFAPLRVSA